MSDLAIGLRQVRAEQRGFWRNPVAAFFGFGFPIMFLLIFGAIFNKQTTCIDGTLGNRGQCVSGTLVPYNTFFVPAMAAWGVITTCFSNLTISVVASPAATNVLYPGGNGDVVVTISNPNAYPVTITAVNLPANSVYATGYTTSALTTQQAGCLASTPSDVDWNYSTATSGTSHNLTTPLTVGASGQANDPLVVTFTSDASMLSATPAACENTYFSMPSLTGVTATGGAATSTTSPATDSWTS